MSRLPPACNPPEIIFTMGMGNTGSRFAVARADADLARRSPEPVQMHVKLFAPRGRRGVRHCQRDPQHGVGSQPTLVRRAVKLNQPGIDRGLIVQIHAVDAGAITFLTFSTARAHAQPAVAF